MLAQLAGVLHLADYILAANGNNTQSNLTVAEQDLIAPVDRFRQLLEGCADAFRVAGNISRGDRKPLAETKTQGKSAIERTGSNFGALQVGQDGDGFFVLLGGRAHRGHTLRVIVMRTLREVQAGHIHAPDHHPVNDSVRGTGGAEGANYLGFAASHNGKGSAYYSLLSQIR